MILPRSLSVLDEAFVECGGRLYCPFSWWRFARLLASHTESATLFVPVKTVTDPGDAYPVDPGPLRVVGRPYYVRMHEFYARLPRMWRRLRTQCRELAASHDLVIGRMPGPASRWAAAAAARAGKPFALLVAGDVVAGSVLTTSDGLSRRLLRGILGRMARGQENWVARHSVFVGVWDTQMRPRFEKLCRHVAPCQSPNLTADLLTWREDTPRATPIRLLRVARLSPVKNVELLLDAMAKLVASGRNVALDIVGSTGIPSYTAEIRRRIEHNSMKSHVTLHGGLPFGEALFDRYRMADIHVISSSWEGLPRCLAEARALCVPTVATAVGGIPSAISDGEDGLLVPAGDSGAMAAAIARLIDDTVLRHRIIAGGFERARESTAEFHARRIADLIATALADSHSSPRGRG